MVEDCPQEISNMECEDPVEVQHVGADALDIFADDDRDDILSRLLSEKAVTEILDSNAFGATGSNIKKQTALMSGARGNEVSNLTFMSKSVYSLVSNIFKCPVSEETLKSNITLSAPKIPFLGLRNCDSWLKTLNPNIVPEALESEMLTQRYISNFLRVAFPLVNLLDGLSKGRVTQAKVETSVTDALLLLSSAFENVNCWRRENIMRSYNINHVKCPEISPCDSPCLFPSSFESRVFNVNGMDDADDLVLPDLEINAVAKFGSEIVAGSSTLSSLHDNVDKLIDSNRMYLKSKGKPAAAPVAAANAPASGSSSIGGKAFTESGESRSTSQSLHSSNRPPAAVTTSNLLEGHRSSQTSIMATKTAPLQSLGATKITDTIVTTDKLDTALDPASARKVSSVTGPQETSNRAVSGAGSSGGNHNVKSDTDYFGLNSSPFADVSSSITIEDSPDDDADEKNGVNVTPGGQPATSFADDPEVIVVKSDEENRDDDIEVLDNNSRKRAFVPITGPSPPAAAAAPAPPSHNPSKPPKINVMNSKKQPIRQLPPPNAVLDIARSRGLSNNSNVATAFPGSPLSTGMHTSLPQSFLMAASVQQQQSRQRALHNAAVVAGFPMPNQFASPQQRVIRAVDVYQPQAMQMQHTVPLKRSRYDRPVASAPAPMPWMEQSPRQNAPG
jgi:hypothetical protein